MEPFFNTKSVHFLQKEKGENQSKARPIYQTSAFVFKDLADMEQYFKGEKDYLYTRYGNPNTDDLGKGVALLECAEDGVATSSGMSAILCAVLAFCKTGDHLIATMDVYGGTYALLEKELSLFGIEVSFVHPNENWEAYIKSNTKGVFAETISNPLVRVENLEDLIDTAKRHDLLVIVDNTFATPYLLQPYVLGADLVIHSATKYIGGHSDVTAGVIVGRQELVDQARARVIALGSNLSPFEAWLACRGLKTLALRMERQCQNAAELATTMQETDGVKHVYYPQFVSEKGNGAIVSIELDQKANVERFFSAFTFVKVAPTLAGVETSISYPLNTSHRSVPEEMRKALNIGTHLIRISVGIEDGRNIIAEFQEAVRKSLL